jgi:hypothetical protein
VSVADSSTSTRADYAAPKATPGKARRFTIVSFVCAAIALVLLPPIVGVVGAVFGFIGYAKGDRLGLWAGLTSIVAVVAGLMIAAMIMSANS